MWLHLIYLICLLTSSVTGFVYFKSLKSRKLSLFPFFLLLVFGQELIVFLLVRHNPSYSTGFIYNLYNPVNALFFAIFYYRIPFIQPVRKLIGIMTFVFLTATLVSFCYVQSIFIYNSYISLGAGFLITLCGLLFLFNYFKLDNHSEEKKWLPVIWITIGLVAFYPVVNISFALYKYLLAYQATVFGMKLYRLIPQLMSYIHVCLFYQGILFMQQGKVDLIISVVAASLFILLLVISVFFLFRIYLKRKNKLLLENERMNIEFEQTLLKSQMEIQEHYV